MSILDNVNYRQLEEAPDFYSQFPVGECPAYIIAVQEKVSRNGNNMLQIVFENDKHDRIAYYLVEGDYFLSRLKALYTAFKIPLGEKDTRKWIGKQGIVVTKLDENSYDGRKHVKVSHVRSIKTENQPNNRRYEEYTDADDDREYNNPDKIPF
ncbi:MAG: hypothetical protein LBJ41_01785 [Treponema sp.]|jgi:hypothetical protein|nr:hypothetical protein [Treponema sp.]